MPKSAVINDHTGGAMPARYYEKIKIVIIKQKN